MDSSRNGILSQPRPVENGFKAALHVDMKRLLIKGNLVTQNY